MTLTAEEHAWVLDTARQYNELAVKLQGVSYKYRMILTRGYDATVDAVVAVQIDHAAVSLAERVLRGVERIGEP
jgi:hypothetical protein